VTCPMFRTTLWAFCTLLGLCCATVRGAAPKSETLLPDTAKGYISVADIGVLRESFNRTQWGQLVHDSAMQPFVEDFRHQLQQKGVRQLEEMGLSWQELEGVPGGGISIALVRPQPGRRAVVMMIDITGHKDQATALLEKIGTNLVRRGATPLPRDSRDTMIIYNLPVEEGKRAGRQAAYFLKDDLLAASDDLETLQRIASAMATDRTDSLTHFKPFHEIMERCDKSAGGVSTQVRWFIEPFGYATMVREAATGPRRKGVDLLSALKNQGFTVIQGVGGYLNFSADGCDLVHRTMVYAPPLPGHENSADKYELAARLLKFPTSSDLEPQSWVPRHVATYNTFNLDIKTAFAAVGPLVDEIAAEKGVFHDVLDSLKNDPQGPQVDIEKDLIGNLGTRVSIVTDYQLPIGPKSERLLVAVETANESMVAETVAKTMKGDACRREFEGHVIWEIVDEECAVPDVKIEDSGAINRADREDVASADKKAKDHPLMQNAAVTVAFGHLFVASNLGFLETILHQAGKSDGLASCADYRLVANQIKALGGSSDMSFRLFSRTDEEYRPTYELIRTGQMPKSESVLGQLLNALLGDGKDGVVRKQRIDGGKLPEFDTISHYFGPAGTFVASETNGWFITGFMLDKAKASEPTAANDAGPRIDAAAAAKPAGEAAAKDAAAVKEASAAKESPAKDAPVKSPSATQTAPAAVTGQKEVETTTK
jgi:hypothetical protein